MGFHSFGDMRIFVGATNLRMLAKTRGFEFVSEGTLMPVLAQASELKGMGSLVIVMKSETQGKIELWAQFPSPPESEEEKTPADRLNFRSISEQERI